MKIKSQIFKLLSFTCKNFLRQVCHSDGESKTKPLLENLGEACAAKIFQKCQYQDVLN